LLAAYRRLLGPLIRILIRNGVDYSEFSQVAKEAYVEVATKDFRVKSGQISSSRVAVLTGLSQKSVEKEEKRAQVAKGTQTSNLDDIAGVLYGWHTDSDFAGPYGLPLELRYSTNTPENADIDGQKTADFGELVRRHAGNADPKPLLKELIGIGAVVETEKNWFKALKRHYIPAPMAPQGLDHLAISVEDFVTTLDHNLNEDRPTNKLFERTVYTEEGITPENLERFTMFSGQKAQLLLEEIDNWISQLDTPKRQSKTILKTGLGIYHYIRQEENES
jgi:hypothetical protein